MQFGTPVCNRVGVSIARTRLDKCTQTDLVRLQTMLKNERQRAYNIIWYKLEDT